MMHHRIEPRDQVFVKAYGFYLWLNICVKILVKV